MELISADELKSFFEKFDPERKRMLSSGDVIGIIKNQETIDAEPVVHAHWRKLPGWTNRNTVQCSKCGNFLDIRGVNASRGNAKYCPNCGAKMDEY